MSNNNSLKLHLSAWSQICIFCIHKFVSFSCFLACTFSRGWRLSSSLLSKKKRNKNFAWCIINVLHIFFSRRLMDKQRCNMFSYFHFSSFLGRKFTAFFFWEALSHCCEHIVNNDWSLFLHGKRAAIIASFFGVPNYTARNFRAIF